MFSVLHAGAFAYALVTGLAIAFTVTARTGLLDKEVVVPRRPWLRAAWLSTISACTRR